MRQPLIPQTRLSICISVCPENFFELRDSLSLETSVKTAPIDDYHNAFIFSAMYDSHITLQLASAALCQYQ